MKWALITIIAFGTILLPTTVFAQTTDIPHYTILLNQVRGPECCDRGSLRFFKEQQQGIIDNNLTGNFAIRYDALQNDDYVAAITNDTHNQYGALLEITPQLAQDAGVAYKGDSARWYEAQNVYLIGYTQEERQKIIDQYLKIFEEKLGRLPQFSSSWMIDAWSLAYLKKNYGIRTHQTTREQFGTDSYTLYGGPVHYPFYPSTNWALMPQENNEAMPLIIRQTIMDPVFVYGDQTDSYTSQPNDYYLRQDTTEYFKHLFYQAHNQANDYTFALVGLENTMPENIQAEYQVQLREIAAWQQASENNQTMAIPEFEKWKQQHRRMVSSYGGEEHKVPTEQAWWITTQNYRARVRLTGGELAITDLRVYESEFTDPYYQVPAKNLGWWVVPFVLDGSRYFESSPNGNILKNDGQTTLAQKAQWPMRIMLLNEVTDAELLKEGDTRVLMANGARLATFKNGSIELAGNVDLRLPSDLPEVLTNLQWQPEEGTPAYWGFKTEGTTLIPFVNNTDLAAVREAYRSYLFPEKEFDIFEPKTSILFPNNRYAMAGRNPVRIVLFPRNAENEPILLPHYPAVTTAHPVDDISFEVLPKDNDPIHIDLTNAKPMTTTVTITEGEFSKELRIYFAPNCKTDIGYCLTHPRHAWWFVRNYIGDKLRARAEQ